ncbi:MAG: thiamine-phosphate kinase [Pirellulaceae bacterium]
MKKASFEFQFHDWLAKNLSRGTQTIVGIGDDAAVMKSPAGNLVITHDALCEGVHFLRPDHPLKAIGRKSLAVSLSDIAAMGGVPTAAVISLVLPRSLDLEAAGELMRGVAELAREFAVEIVGGDTNRWDQGLVIGSTVIGHCERPWQMSGAQDGDVLVTTGPFGGSLAGHHLYFEPKCKIASCLASRYKINAATDVSDSLSIDLQAICDASSVGAVLDQISIPISAACQERHCDEETALRHALTDGEDFELLLAVAPDVWLEMSNELELRGQLFQIGEFRSQTGIWMREPSGREKIVEVAGYEH